MAWLPFLSGDRVASSALHRFKVVPVGDALQAVLSAMQPSLVLDSLRSTLLNRAEPARTAVIEEGYLDVDYSQSHYLQRSRAFTPSSRRTRRVHFFSSDFSRRQLLALSTTWQSLLSKSYLGYTVVRPTSPETLGRTFIEPPEHVEGKSAFFPTRARFPANLCGLPLEVSACPYLSQDQMVMACATASLWMSSSSLCTKGVDIPAYTTSDITRLALALNRATYGPTVGGGGLRIQEMERAFVSMGYDPILSEYPEAGNLLESSYIYLESGIPPVLTVFFPEQTLRGRRVRGLHAITVVGHTMDTSFSRPLTVTPDMATSATFMPHLIVNDDQNGMYLCADVLPAAKDQEPYRATLEISVSGQKLVGFCSSMLVPLPPRVLLTGEVAQRAAASWLSFARSEHWLKSDPLVLRCFLVRANRLKESFMARAGSPVSRALSVAYRGLSMPRYVWVVEYGYLRDWAGSQLTGLSIQGEMILDPTSPATLSPDFLAIHVPGAVVVRGAGNGDRTEIKWYPVRDDHPYAASPIRDRP